MQILGLFGAVIGSQIIIVLVPILQVRRKCKQKQSETAIIFSIECSMYALRLNLLVQTLMHTRKGETYVKKTKYKISISALYQYKFQRRNGQTSLPFLAIVCSLYYFILIVPSLLFSIRKNYICINQKNIAKAIGKIMNIN